MIPSQKQSPIPRVIAIILVSILLALQFHRFDASSLAKLNSMPAADVVQKQRELHQHSVMHQFIMMLILGGFYIGIADVFTYIVALAFKNPGDRKANEPNAG